MTLQQIFITNLKRVRKEQGLSQMVLSEKCGTTSNYIGQIEMGRRIPSFDKIEEIAFALKIQPYELFYAEEKQGLKTTDNETKEFTAKLKAKIEKDLKIILEKDIDSYFNDLKLSMPLFFRS